MKSANHKKASAHAPARHASRSDAGRQSFSQFISEPPVSVAIIAFALLALVFALFNFNV